MRTYPPAINDIFSGLPDSGVTVYVPAGATRNYQGALHSAGLSSDSYTIIEMVTPTIDEPTNIPANISANIPKTSDNAMPELWVGMILMALTALIGNALLYRRKRKAEQ